jgi:ATP-dependent RNA helicase DDX24/MAK5
VLHLSLLSCSQINPINIWFPFTLVQYPGRTLVFVNSIKTARRLDGLLRALGINSRALHAQLQQKQRLNALESFTDLPVGVLGTV